MTSERGPITRAQRKAARLAEKTGPERVDARITPGLRLRIDPDQIPWIYSALMSDSQVSLYQGGFPEPFDHMVYYMGFAQNQLFCAAVLSPNDDFNKRNGKAVGKEEDFSTMISKYPAHQFNEDGSQLILFKDDAPYGFIERDNNGNILIRSNAAFNPSEQDSQNALSLTLDKFNLMVQRYVAGIWGASPETDQKQISLSLGVPNISEGAIKKYYSTFQIIGGEYREKPREISLDEIGGYPRVKDLIQSLLMDIDHPETSRLYGTQPFSNKFVLLTGPEGSGKTLFPKALHAKLEERHPSQFEHYRLKLQQIINERGPQAVNIIQAILEHLEENEKKGVPSLLHLDGLEPLVPPENRSDHQVQPVEWQHYMMVVNPIRIALGHFGRELGAQSHHVIVIGEARMPRSFLPDDLSSMFRRSFNLNPNVKDLEEIIRVQIATTRKFAAKTGRDPFKADIDSAAAELAQGALGLVGLDVKRALINITDGLKANHQEGQPIPEISPARIAEEFNIIRMSKGIAENKPKRPIGFRSSLD